MQLRVRPAAMADAEACGRVCFDGYAAVYERHGFAAPFASVAVATRRVRALIENPASYGVVATGGGAIAGFNFLSELDPVRAVGPLVIAHSVTGGRLGYPITGGRPAPAANRPR